MKRRLFLAIAVFAGCGGSRPLAEPAAAPRQKPVADAGAPAPTADAGEEAGRPATDPRFAIADRGREPRRELGRVFQAGSSERLELSTVTRVMQKGAELAASVVEAPVDVHVREVTADGAARFEARLGPFRYRTRGDPELVRMMTQGGAKAGVLGDTIDGHATITGHGLVDHVKFEGSQKHPEAVALALAASLMSSAEALPSAKLGTGARWRVHSSADVRGQEVDLVARYRLVSLGADRARLRVEHEQPVFAPGSDAGDAKVVKKDSEGEWVYRQGRVFPQGSEIMKRPLPIPGTQDLELWSEVHLAAR